MAIQWRDDGGNWWVGKVGVIRRSDNSYDVYLLEDGLWQAVWSTCVWDDGCYDFWNINLHPEGPDGEGFENFEDAIRACEEHHKAREVD